jgi:NADPH-dependent 2,4-dienoyl-CoA reductase/sulfur reductase-like enzyme
VTVIAVSFFESVVRDHSKDHSMTVTYSCSDTLTGIRTPLCWTQLRDTADAPSIGPWNASPAVATQTCWLWTRQPFCGRVASLRGSMISTVRAYDDGGSHVPGGITAPVEHVVVIGAGIAGLTIANALRHGGVECVLLEARDRIGGRLNTVELAGSPVDMGASWIHHPVGNPLREFAE